MRPATIQYDDQGTHFAKRLSYMVSIGALLICSASMLATQSFALATWPYILTLGIVIIVLSIFIGFTEKMLRKSGVVKADKKLPHNLTGKRLLGT